MEYKKQIYFTITAPSLDESRCKITALSQDGLSVDWCYFSHIERLEEEKWRLVFIITKPYYYTIGSPSIRYCYVVGVMYSNNGDICRALKIDDNIRIKQEGCLHEVIGLASSNSAKISQGCEFVVFLKESDTVQSQCSYEGIEIASSNYVEIEQKCESVRLLISYETTLEDECSIIKLASNNNVDISQECERVDFRFSGEMIINQSCQEILL